MVELPITLAAPYRSGYAKWPQPALQ